MSWSPPESAWSLAGAPAAWQDPVLRTLVLSSGPVCAYEAVMSIGVGMAARITELWAGIDEWLQRNAPRTFATLNPPADTSTLSRLAEQLGLELPDELVEVLRGHNGADNSSVGPGFSFPGEFYFLDSAEIAEYASVCMTVLRQAPDGRGRMWHESWIPFAADFGGYYLVYDTRRRRPFGTVFYRDLVEGPWSASWHSLEDMFADTLDALLHKRVSRAQRLPRDYPRLGGWATTRATVVDGALRWKAQALQRSH